MMSKAARTQLVVLDIITGVIDSIVASFELSEMEVTQEVQGLVNMLEVARERCFKSIVPTGRLELDPKAYKTYAKKVLTTTEIIRRRWPNSMPALEFLNTGVALVESVRDQISKTTTNEQRLRKERWLTLIERLMAIYNHYDPDWEANEAMDIGIEVADEILAELRR